MTEPIKFTNASIKCDGKSYTIKMQEGISIRDKQGKEFLFKDGKWQTWDRDANRKLNIADDGYTTPGAFVDYEEYEGGFLGFFKTKKEKPDIEITKGQMQCYRAIMDNDGKKDDLTIKDIDIAREQYQAGKLTKDFAKHGVGVRRSQSEYSGYKNNKLQVDIYDNPGTFRIDYYNDVNYKHF